MGKLIRHRESDNEERKVVPFIIHRAEKTERLSDRVDQLQRSVHSPGHDDRYYRPRPTVIEEEDQIPSRHSRDIFDSARTVGILDDQQAYGAASLHRGRNGS